MFQRYTDEKMSPYMFFLDPDHIKATIIKIRGDSKQSERFLYPHQIFEWLNDVDEAIKEMFGYDTKKSFEEKKILFEYTPIGKIMSDFFLKKRYFTVYGEDEQGNQIVETKAITPPQLITAESIYVC